MPLTCPNGRFVFSVRRTLFVRRDALVAKVYVRMEVNTRSFQWVDAGREPTRIRVQHEWLPSAEAVLAEAREATVGWSRRLGTSTVVVLVHPSIAEAVSARRGMSRFHEKASRVTDLHTVSGGNGLAVKTLRHGANGPKHSTNMLGGGIGAT